jgi:peptidoglycan/LPS O-acetylase OafA/YrhL
MYVFYAWLIEGRHYHISEAAPQALLAIAVSLVLAWLCLKFYDIPLRRSLSARFLRGGKNVR